MAFDGGESQRDFRAGASRRTGTGGDRTLFFKRAQFVLDPIQIRAVGEGCDEQSQRSRSLVVTIILGTILTNR